jgi:dinuclear metal center YbgI/SA1388 family protein
MIIVKEVIKYLEEIAPPSLQEGYDNSGLIVGRNDIPVTGVLVSLDCNEEIVQEAIDKKINLIVSHHPIVFSGLKRFNEKNYVERTVAMAIKNDINLYAIHTNLDNVLHQGVNGYFAEKLGLQNIKPLRPLSNHLLKLFTYVPNSHAKKVREALFNAGAGNIGNYDQCSFNLAGTGTFRGNDQSNPYLGKSGVLQEEPEVKIEVLLRNYQQSAVLRALHESHPYEEVAYEFIKIENSDQELGAGAIGELTEEMEVSAFLNYVKKSLNLDVIKYTQFSNDIKKVAICGGSGSFLRKDALMQKADAYISADFKYHEFFDAENHLMFCDIGHYESEKYTIELLVDYLTKKFSTFATLKTDKDTNPINYYF